MRVVIDETVVVVRVWLPDRPGALGLVASRIGAVRGDLLSIDVLERGGGRAVDELTVALPDETLTDLLVNEIGQVDGVDVEDVRPAVGGAEDRAVRALVVASTLIAAGQVEELHTVFVDGLVGLLGVDWAVLMGPTGSLAASGEGAPASTWLAAFIAGASAVEHAAADVAALTANDGMTHLVIGREHPTLRSVEMSVAAELLRLMVDHRAAIGGNSDPAA